MTATDELRRLLDERGVEWKDYGYENHTWWSGGENVGWHAENRPSVRGLYVKIEAVLTPEQAIAATLGRRECHPVISDNLTESEGTGDAWADCSECGHLLFVLTDPRSEVPNFCPNCGRRVVDE